jgi:hypothetical protein
MEQEAARGVFMRTINLILDRAVLPALFLALVLALGRLVGLGADVYLIGVLFVAGLLVILLLALAKRALVFRHFGEG